MNQLATLPDTEISPIAWQTMKEQAQVLVQSGMLPPSIKTWQAATAIMMKGKELGLPPMQAFSHINVIMGKIAISAELMMTLIYRAYPKAKIDFEKIANDGCGLVTIRPGGKPTHFKFDVSDAKAAGLLGKEMWSKYPRAMYRSRCVSEMARTIYPDALMGASYTPEELGATVNEEGEVIDAEAVNVESPAAAPVENPPPAEVYMAIGPQQHRLLAALKSRKIDEVLWEDISKEMVGKIISQRNVQASIDAIVKKHSGG